jgi:hypothetical protein
MSDIHSCSKCDSILVKSHQVTEYRNMFELPLSSLLESSGGPNPCKFFKTLFEKCQMPQGHLQTASDSRIVILLDKHIDSSNLLSVTVLPRKPQAQIGRFRSAVGQYEFMRDDESEMENPEQRRRARRGLLSRSKIWRRRKNTKKLDFDISLIGNLLAWQCQIVTDQGTIL